MSAKHCDAYPIRIIRIPGTGPYEIVSCIAYYSLDECVIQAMKYAQKGQERSVLRLLSSKLLFDIPLTVDDFRERNAKGVQT